MANITTKVGRIRNMDISATLDDSDPSKYIAVTTGDKHIIDLPLNGKNAKVYVEPAEPTQKETT